MLFDHMGFILFPSVILLRCVGRLAMPVFAFLIAEGVIHTSNKLKYFLRVFILGVLCQLAYVISELIRYGRITDIYFNILLTLSAGILICYLWQAAVRNKKLFALFAIVLLLAIGIEIYSGYSHRLGFSVEFDYGLMGMLLPLFAMIFNKKIYRIAMFAAGICLLCILDSNMHIQWICLLSLPLLWLYDGTRGKLNLKYLFYIFYPAHLAVLYGISLLV